MASFSFILVVFLASACLNVDALFGINKNGKSKLHKNPLYHENIESLNVDEVEEKYMNITESHGHIVNDAKFPMRYMENRAHFKPGGPIFIFLGGEWTISKYDAAGGHMYDIAKEMQGIIFATEHRFYGKTFPTPNINLESLRLLMVEQALHDVVEFIANIKETIPETADSAVFLVGCSYSASMAIWLRQKFPGVIQGAWASSGPVHAQPDFYEYKEIVASSVQLVGGTACYNRIQSAYVAIEALVASGDGARLAELFNLCAPVDTTRQLDIWALFHLLSDEVAAPVQYHRGWYIGYMCDKIMDSDSDIEGFAAFIRDATYGDGGCFETRYDAFVEMTSETELGLPMTEFFRQWVFQTCSQFGWYQTSSSDSHPFGPNFPLELYTTFCGDVFEHTFSNASIYANTDQTNAVFGGFDPAVTNVFFTQGQLDPWRAVGVQNDLNPNSPAVIIPMASHCQDISPILPSDSSEMLAVKERIKDLFLEWSVDYWLDNPNLNV